MMNSNHSCIAGPTKLPTNEKKKSKKSELFTENEQNKQTNKFVDNDDDDDDDVCYDYLYLYAKQYISHIQTNKTI